MDERPKLELSRWRRYTTIEPIIFLLLLAASLSDNVRLDLIIYQTCRIYNAANNSICDILHKNSSSPEAIALQGKIQPHTSLILILQSCITTIYPAFLSFYLGPWSDKNGRKPVLCIALLGHTLEYIVLCALSVLDVNPYWFLAPTVISSLLGGFPALMTATVCYASDLSDRKSRTWHLVWFDSAFNCGILAGTLLAPIVFNTYGYSIVFSISAGCLFTSWLYTQFCVPETITNQERTSIFDNSFVKESFSAAIKKREGFDRKIVWTCIIAIALQVVIIQGHLQISYMFSNIRLGWNITDFSIFASTVCTLSIVGSMSMVKFVKFIDLPDTINIIMAYISIFASSIVKAFTIKPWQFYLAGGIGILGGSATPVLRAIVSKFVPHNDIGKVFSLITSMEMIVPFMTTPLYVLIYTKFPPPLFPCPVWFLSAFIAVINFILICCVQRRISSNGREYVPFVQESH